MVVVALVTSLRAGFRLERALALAMATALGLTYLRNAGLFAVVGAALVPKGKNGLLFYSKTGPLSVPIQGGFLCVAAPTRRTPVQSSGGAGSCGGSFAFDFNAYIASGADAGLVPGQGVWAQYWFRDPQSPSSTGLTNAVRFVIEP